MYPGGFPPGYIVSGALGRRFSFADPMLFRFLRIGEASLAAILPFFPTVVGERSTPIPFSWLPAADLATKQSLPTGLPRSTLASSGFFQRFQMLRKGAFGYRQDFRHVSLMAMTLAGRYLQYAVRIRSPVILAVLAICSCSFVSSFTDIECIICSQKRNNRVIFYKGPA